MEHVRRQRLDRSQEKLSLAGPLSIVRQSMSKTFVRQRTKEFRNTGIRIWRESYASAVPLLHEGIFIGAILIRRFQVRPFIDSQIALLETFADQAVIAIENVRLFQELRRSTLEQQAASPSEILGVIASSPTDLQPVLDTIAKSAAQVCSADDAADSAR